MEPFDSTLEYKLIYVFSMPYEDHKGLLKVGETMFKSNLPEEDFPSNSKGLNQPAHKRIKQIIGTAGARYDLLYTELASRQVRHRMYSFSDHDVQAVLKNSGIRQIRPNGETGKEWYETDLETVKKAIRAVKEGRHSLTMAELAEEKTKTYGEIEFRDEQKDAIEKTLKIFKKKKEMLWYAKMRFGKTLSALEVIRRSQYRRVIIATHRPVVDDGWSEDFKKIFFPGHSEHEYKYEKKTKDSAYVFDEKTDLENDLKIKKLDNDGDYFIYFTSIQDLRGSKRVGGNYNKNNAVFDLDWDLVIIDEAHEGTQTELGDQVLKALRKKHTKILSLSGTPFNLLNQYDDDNTYVWDYVMEQKAKEEWEKTHGGDHNPYADLPKMHFYTYDLGDTLRKYVTDESDSKAFNFREFFSVWYKGPNGQRKLPEGAEEGTFRHEDDVRRFLNLLATDSKETGYPFATKEYRDMFRHTLWMVPGVKEAKALSSLLREHPVFCHFGIANVAGEGDTYESEHKQEALALVRDTIQNHDYSITLSCGKLTTGVTVKEWSAVLMMAGAYTVAPAQYMQTIFRVQSAGSVNGKQKTDCYVFDFAPDRALKVLAESANLSKRPGKNQKEERAIMGEFLNYCPVIAISGSKTKRYDVPAMMQKLKQIYAIRAVDSGFTDNSLYNDKLLHLTDLDAAKFNKLKEIVGKSGANETMTTVVINNQGLDNEKRKTEKKKPKTGKTKSEEEKEAERKRKEEQAARRAAISILRAISIRIPLLIYGADVPLEEDIDVRQFVELVDEKSWQEFMPQGVTKRLFLEYEEYYDMDVFIAAGKNLRKRVRDADRETPTRRIRMLTDIFKTFRNPDKETVLTPWRVVNMHMAETLGGWCFYDYTLEEDIPGVRHSLDEPRFVDQGDVTRDVFSPRAKILEINSKTGLYPLYLAYTFYRKKIEDTEDDDWSPKECLEFWDAAVRENVYIICKTEMAKSITRRTLCGYRDIPCNAHCFKDLVNTIKNKPDQFKKRILRGTFWNKEVKKMDFSAVVGNPPYQETVAKQEAKNNGQARTKSIFPYFQLAADDITSLATSLIYPGARWIHRSGKGMNEFGFNQINDPTLARVIFYPNSAEVFSNVEIADGISVVYKNKKKNEFRFEYLYNKGGDKQIKIIDCPGNQLLPLNPKDGSIVAKVDQFVTKNKFGYLHDRVLPQKLFGIESNFVEENPGKVKILDSEEDIDYTKQIKLFTNDKAGKAGRATWFIVDKDLIQTSSEYIDEWQVVVSSAAAGGQKRDNQIEIIDNHSAFGRSRVAIGSFKTEEEAQNFYNYCNTSIIRFMFLMTDEALTSVGKKVPDIMSYRTSSNIINFEQDINKQLSELIGLTDEEVAYIESVV